MSSWLIAEGSAMECSDLRARHNRVLILGVLLEANLKHSTSLFLAFPFLVKDDAVRATL
jgi:hypothetical protein